MLIYLLLINALQGKKFACQTELPEWAGFQESYFACKNHSYCDLLSLQLSDLVLSNQARVLECPVGVIAGFSLIGQLSVGFRSFRAYQLAMVYIYVLRNRNRVPPEEEQRWGVSTDAIMHNIQSLRIQLNREYPILPAIHTMHVKVRVGIVTMCIYPPDANFLIASATPRNRYMYARRHGYEALVYTEHVFPDVDIQHSKLALLVALLETNMYDWLMWTDCDSVIINGSKTIESILEKYPMTDLLLTEELLGISSANFLVKNTPWSIAFLKQAFQICHNEIPLFGDQDGIIVAAMLEPTLSGCRKDYRCVDPHIAIVPQNEFNAYDALNAHHMNCAPYSSGDLLVTFPQCREVGCNALFKVAFDAADAGNFNVPIVNRSAAELRVFGPS